MIRSRRLKSGLISSLLGNAVGNNSSGQLPSFTAPLRTSLLPSRAGGSYSPTFTRATIATVLGYAANATIADGPTILTVASGEARFLGARRVSEGVWSDVDANGVALTTGNGASSLCCDAQGPLGYFREGARTNLCLRSQELEDVAWTASNITVSSNDTTAPDGTTTAELLTASAGNGTLKQGFTITNDHKAFSIWLKRKTGTGNIDITLDNGSTWTTKVITSSWARYEITQVVTNPTIGIRIVTSGDAVWAWGAQLENGATFASSYIPTTSASVTRDVDSLTYAASGNFPANAAPSTITFETYPYAYGDNATTVGGLLSFMGTTETFIYHYTPVALGGNLAVGTNGVGEIASGAANVTSLNTLNKIAISLSVNGTATVVAVVGGALKINGTTGITATSVSTIRVGDSNSQNRPAYGTFRNLNLYSNIIATDRLTQITT